VESRYETNGEDAADYDLVGTVVNCRVCELGITLQLLTVTICKCSMNRVTNPTPTYSYSKHVTISIRLHLSEQMGVP
jgi:hypothetical protein